MTNGKHSQAESGINVPSGLLLDKGLQAYAESPDFKFTVDKIRSFLESGNIDGVVELIRLGALKPSEIEKIIKVCKEDPKNQKFVSDLEQVLREGFVYGHLFDLEDQIMSARTDFGLKNLINNKTSAVDIETLRSLLQLYEEGRQDPGGCKEKIKTALRIV